MNFISLFIAHLFISGVASTTFTVTNKCNYTIWLGILLNEEHPPLSTTGFSLQKGQSNTISAPASWGGLLWSSTYCTEDSTGKFPCITGDCGSGKLECLGNGADPPSTLAEFKLDGSGCVVDLNRAYSSELMVTRSVGETMPSKSVCQAFGSLQYCASANYQIIFCAAKNSTPKRRLAHKFITSNIKVSSVSASINKTATGNMTVISNAPVTTPAQPEYIKPSPSPASSSPPPGVQTVYPSPTSSSPPSGVQTVYPLPPNSSPPLISPSPLPEIRPNSTPKRRLAPIIAGVIGGALLIISLVVILILRARWGRKSKKSEDVEDDHIKQVPGMPVRFSYEDLRIATNDFKETLGRGGFGSVFKGVLKDGTGIAVKRLDRLGQGRREFLAEVETIGSLHHFNLVRLTGFCSEKSYTLLVYEYMSNGSLDTWIFKKNQRSSLDWQTRKKIILDIAKGLTYLHEDCRQTIMHLDIKPQNILLDTHFNAKISDFGLSKLMDKDMSQVQLSMRGTPGYLAPEWRQPRGRITVKVDIYSFGIVLLEVVCARRNADNSQPDSAFHLLTMLQKEAVYIVDHLDENMQSDREEIIRMIKIAAWCLQDDPESRPLMSTVVKVLEGVMEVDPNLVYQFSHALTSSPVVNQHISSAPMPASVLSYPR